MRHILIILIIFIPSFCFNSVSAQETTESASNWLKEIYQQTGQKVIDPVKRMIDSMKQKHKDLPQNIEKKSQGIFERVQEKAEMKQEEIKQEIKKEIKKQTKNWFQNKLDRVKQLLNPLKIKIQEGSTLIREWVVNGIKEKIFN
jgi:DNA anti-recombination protein RmuC